jgi:HTH-type transcriptional regulator, quorum sensing regulator NprR
MKNPKEALHFYEKSLAMQPTKNQHYLVTLYAVGELHHSLNSLDKAKDCIKIPELIRDFF